MSATYRLSSSLATHKAIPRFSATDPKSYLFPPGVDATVAWSLVPWASQLIDFVDRSYTYSAIRIKNTTGSTLSAYTLLSLVAPTVNTPVSKTSLSSPSAGPNTVFTFSSSSGSYYEVGQIVKIESANSVIDFAIVTAISLGDKTITVGQTANSHNTPVITSIPYYIPTKAQANTVYLADCITEEDISNGSYGWAFTFAHLTGIDPALTPGNVLYLSSTPGVWTTSPGSFDSKQTVGVVVGDGTEVLSFPGARLISEYGSPLLARQRLKAHQDTVFVSETEGDVIRYRSGQWKNEALPTDPDEKVKASSTDPTAGYLDAKADGVTLEVATAIQALQVKDNSLGVEKLHLTSSSRLLGRGTTGAGAAEEIALSSDYGLVFTFGASSLKINTPQDLQTTATPQFAGLTITKDGKIKPSANGTTAIQFAQADGTVWAVWDTTNKRLGIGTTAPAEALHFVGALQGDDGVSSHAIVVKDGSGNIAFRGVQSTPWADHVTAQYFQIGASHIVFQAQGGATAGRFMINAATLQVCSGDDWTAVVPTGIFEVSDGTNHLFNVFSEGNAGLGQTTFGTSAAKVLAIATGTAPSTSPADCFQMYSADQAAGNACAHFRTEGGAVVKLYQLAHVADPAGGTTVDAEARSAINSILSTLESLGFHATS